MELIIIMSKNVKMYLRLFLFLLYGFFQVPSGFATESNPPQVTKSDSLKLATFDVDATPPVGSIMAYDTVVNSWDMSLRTRDYVMWSQNPTNSYCAWPLDLVLTLPKNVKEYQYYVTDEYTIGRTSLDGELIPYADLIKEFRGSPLDIPVNYSNLFVHQALSDRSLGPTVKIYKLNFDQKN